MNISAKSGNLRHCIALLTENKLLNNQLMRVSVIVTILLLTTFQVLLATSVRGQNMAAERVTIGLQHESLVAGIKKIEQQTALRFYYRNAEIKTLDNLNLPFAERTVQETLNELLQNTFFSFRQMDDKILLQKDPQTDYTISGRIVGADHKAIEFATVSLRRKDAPKFIQTTMTDTAGHFKLSAQEKGEYLVGISFIGMDSLSVGFTLGDMQTVKLPDITLTKATKQLKQVTISSNKAPIILEIDKLTYSVKDDPEKAYASTFDVLRKVPLISIDPKEAVEVNGRKSFVILINGKPSSIANRDPALVLGNLAANKVDKIEVITTPPARYSQNGITEVINIVTFDKKFVGFQASVRNLQDIYNTINYNGTNFTGEYKNGNLGITDYSVFVAGSPPDIHATNQIIPNGKTGVVTSQDQEAHSNWHIFNNSPEISYEPDSLSLIIASARINYSPGYYLRNSSSVYTDLDNGTVTNGNFISKDNYLNKEWSYNAYYQHQGKKNHDRLLTVGYKLTKPFTITTDTVIQNIGAAATQSLQNNTSGSDEQTIQVDYSHPLKLVTIEAGAKAVLRKNYSEGAYFNYDLPSRQYIPDELNNTQLNYKQQVYSIYNSYYLKKKNWGLRAALRYEGTRIENEGVNRNYNNFIPSADFQFKFKSSLLSLTYNQEIQRPGITQLNTFKNTANPNFIIVGNPDIVPSVQHDIEASISSVGKNFFRLSAHYNFSKNAINSFTSLLNDSVTQLTYRNTGKMTDLGINLNGNYYFTKSFYTNLDGRFNYTSYDNVTNNGIEKNDGLRFFIINTMSYSIKKVWRIDSYTTWGSPTISIQGKGYRWFENDFSFSRTFYTGRLRTMVSIENPFMGYRNTSTSVISDDFTSIKSSSYRVRDFSISLSYRFGGLKSQIKRNQKTINNTDIKTEQSNY